MPLSIIGKTNVFGTQRQTYLAYSELYGLVLLTFNLSPKLFLT